MTKKLLSSLGNGWFLRLLVSCHLFSPPSIWKSPWEAAWQDDRSIFIEKSGDRETRACHFQKLTMVLTCSTQFFYATTSYVTWAWSYTCSSIRKKKESKSHLPTKYNLETWFLHFWNQMIRAYDMSRMRQEKRILLGSLNRARFFL